MKKIILRFTVIICYCFVLFFVIFFYRSVISFEYLYITNELEKKANRKLDNVKVHIELL